jgi:hypothetical protein
MGMIFRLMTLRTLIPPWTRPLCIILTRCWTISFIICLRLRQFRKKFHSRRVCLVVFCRGNEPLFLLLCELLFHILRIISSVEMGVGTLGDEVQRCVADLDRQTELEVEKAGLTTVAETGASHGDFRLAETGFFLRHPPKDRGRTRTYLEGQRSSRREMMIKLPCTHRHISLSSYGDKGSFLDSSRKLKDSLCLPSRLC